MEITKIGYGIQIRDRHSGTTEEVYMEAVLETSDRERTITDCFQQLKQSTRTQLANDINAEVLTNKIITLERQTTHFQEQIQIMEKRYQNISWLWQRLKNILLNTGIIKDESDFEHPTRNVRDTKP